MKIRTALQLTEAYPMEPKLIQGISPTGMIE